MKIIREMPLDPRGRAGNDVWSAGACFRFRSEGYLNVHIAGYLKSAHSVVTRVCGAFAIMFAVAVPASGSDDLSSPFFSGEGDGKWAAMIFGGQLTENELADIIVPDPDRGARFTDTSFIGAALSREIYRWHGFSVELEGGAGYQFGDFRGVDNSSGQVWGAAYFRYDYFPWNHLIHTSVAGSVGLNYAFRETAFENYETKVGTTEKILHYFSPEIAFSLPDRREHELVIRLHHRSSANGAFGCDGCGSNFVTLGYRHRF